MCKSVIVIAVAVTISVIFGGCAGKYVKGGDILSAGAAALGGVAAYELAPNDWTNSERVALAGGSALAVYLVGKLTQGKIESDEASAFEQGFQTGKAHGARLQYEIIKAMQKDTRSAKYNVYAFPAPKLPGIKTTDHNIYLEVAE
jgi:hypothetical protein